MFTRSPELANKKKGIMKKTIFSIALVLLISACSPSSKQIQEAIKQTKSAIPTNTETKTLEPTFTLNPSKTSTQAPTSTPLYTSTSDYGKFIYYSWIQGFSATDEVIKSFVCKNKDTKD
jgi:phage terminase large subunit-like protein